MKIEAGKDSIVVSNFDDVEVLKIAMKLEKDGAKAYREISSKLDNEKMAKTFVRLSEDEDGHFSVFKSMYTTLLGEKGIDPDDVDVEEGIFDHMDSGIFDGFKALDKIASEKDIIQLAVEVEMKTILFYSEISKQAASQSTKNKVKRIVEEEKLHHDILKSWVEACN